MTRNFYVYLLLLSLNVVAAANDEISSHIRKCCLGGIQYAGKHNSCEKYDHDVNAIPPLWRGLCHSTYGVCCSRKLEDQFCIAGRQAALQGSRCDEQHNTTTYADCCRACQVGLAVKASNNKCNDKLFAYFDKIESYRVCCAEGDSATPQNLNDFDEGRGIEADGYGDDDLDEEVGTRSEVEAARVTDGTIVLQEDDDDICGKVPNLCAHICENTQEAYRCKCQPGYKLDENNVTCSLIETMKADSDTGEEHAHEDEDEVDKDVDEKSPSSTAVKPPRLLHNVENSKDRDVLNVDNDDLDDDAVESDDSPSTLPCAGGYEYNPLQHKCVDVDECVNRLHNCKASQYCHNTEGSYRCLSVKIPDCDEGWRYALLLERCEDINECTERLDDCGTAQQCVNTRGSYKCHALKADILVVDRQKCKSGYVWNVVNEACEDYDECTDVPCEDDYSCLNHPGHYECKKKYIPSGVAVEKPSIDGKCGAGFQHKHGRCLDIDECAEESACDSSQVCTNDFGGYHCDCKIGFNLDTTTNACIDINECSINNHNCLPTQRCDNTVGSYICTRLQSCGTGYTLNAETGNCDDDDECALETHNCPPDYECYNTKGSFRCYRRPPSTTSTTSTTTTTTTTPAPSYSQLSYSYRNRNLTYPSYDHVSQQTYSHTHLRQPTSRYVPPCTIGFQRNHLGACVDVNECLLSNPCGTHQRCINTNGSYRCQNLLQCSAGYKSTPDGSQCEDIDECATGEHNCVENQLCRNRNGGYICSCPPGHQLMRQSNGLSRCVDIDECEQHHPPACPSNAQCLNTIGSYYCECKSGFQKSRDNERICLDVDECQEIPGLCQQKCINYWGGYRCTCNQGFELSADNRTCNDVDECEVHKSYKLCMGYCNNVPGSYECSCPRGYTLAMDKTTCRDIDECATGEFCTGRNDICTNTRGSHRCTTIHCQYGYVNDPEQKNRCRLTSNLCEGDECYNKPSAYTYNFITLVSKLMIPPEGRIIFSLRGPVWYDDIDFDIKIIKIQAAANIEKAADNHFDTIKGKHEAHLMLKRSLEGPQDIELELSMTVFTNGLPRGKSVAKIFILVSQYTF